MRDLHQKRASLDYPIGGAGAVIDALVRGIEVGTPDKGLQGEGGDRGEQTGEGKVLVNSHVSRIIVENGRAVGVQLRQKNKVPILVAWTIPPSMAQPYLPHLPSIHPLSLTTHRCSRPSEPSSPTPVCGTPRSYCPRER